MKKEEWKYKYVFINLFGLLMILFSGITGILRDWVFWYPLGLLTLPTIDSILDILQKRN